MWTGPSLDEHFGGAKARSYVAHHWGLKQELASIAASWNSSFSSPPQCHTFIKQPGKPAWESSKESNLQILCLGASRAVIDTARIDESIKKSSIIDIEKGTRYRFICKLGK